MDLIRTAIVRPIAVLAAVLMVVMFGLLAASRIPIQLTPDVRQPVINVDTSWPGAAPVDIEREIINRQEEALKGLEGVRQMSARARPGRASIELEFAPGQNMDRALLLTANRLDRVGDYPEEADEPALSTSGTEDRSIAWFVTRRLPGNDTPIDHFGDFMEDVVRDRLERVEGISRLNIYGGSERELKVVIDPERMAAHGLTVPELVSGLREANVSLSAGDVDEGKRRYVVRVEGEFETPAQVQDVVIRALPDPEGGGIARLRVGDVARVAFAYTEPTATRRFRGEPAIPFGVVGETDSNVIETMDNLRAAVAELNDGPAKAVGLYLRQVYDETTYINSAIDLVVQNIYVGGLLAAAILTLFLRAAGATLVVTLAIPVSVIGAFVGMAAMGRSLNVISLAGIAFSVGMVVDAAIVVLENIFRLRERGLSRAAAALTGTRQVWGAILVSALTTVMVFIPILILEIEIGQLFRDIAVAISVSVTLSLLVAITVVPALARRLLGKRRPEGAPPPFRLPLIDPAARGFLKGIESLAALVTRRKWVAVGVIGALVAVTSATTWLLLPKLEYLPEGNRNMVFGRVIVPPGYNLETTAALAGNIEQALKPLWHDPEGPPPDPEGPPAIDNFFFVASDSFTFVGATALDPRRAAELIPVVARPVFEEPGALPFVTQPSLFGRSVGGGRSVDLNISGPDLDVVLDVAQQAAGLVGAALPREEGTQLRPRPGLELGAPEVRVLPDPLALADASVSARNLAQTVDAFNDGLRVAEITVGGERIDLTLAGPLDHVASTQGIAHLPVVTGLGTIVPVGSLARVVTTAGPTEIRHLERVRTVTLQIRPADALPLEAAMEILEQQVMAPLTEGGLPDGVRLTLSGTADKLTEAWQAMVWQLLLAVAIVYLVMAVLFESFVYPLIILLTVPMASAGAVLGLALLNVWVRQPLDMLTLLGFVILIGIVVNNAILLVHQTLYHLRVDAMPPAEAIPAATRDRVRPIFMSTLTSLFGMAPLVLFPGAGSELYRGLGTVVLGGLALSAVLTLIIMPPLLSLTVGAIEGRRAGRKRRRRGAKA
ncbi:efflux RND transporter permease subunit [Roseospirillum parvum]|uniref:Hydrophobic/amphiphilic exporter-1, HAE1 family n=1 Tax=Roseospirillum parvum TaxID=83401 RepID=A0A1G8BNA0_9PROT|nr:efflux RND transporter permease subunit [Roseospirillum parvum]SDH34593.1 hydrophobic/amphiphilic exporter-1, HAE1 family [Roseospirillum parvum]